jgi:hypothetical protein
MEGRERVATVRKLCDHAIDFAESDMPGPALTAFYGAAVYTATYIDTHAAPDIINMQRMAREILRAHRALAP